MREIKFRCYLKDSFFKGNEEHPSYEPLLDNRIVKVHSIHFNSKKVIISCPTGGNMSVEFKDIDLMQYTGLKDKNGKEIYEGDIVIYKWINMEKFKVIYDDKEALFSLEPLDIGRKDIWNIGFFKSNMKNHKLEVIGNIYEKGNEL